MPPGPPWRACSRSCTPHVPRAACTPLPCCSHNTRIRHLRPHPLPLLCSALLPAVQAKFMSLALGGPSGYTGRGLGAVHRHLVEEKVGAGSGVAAIPWQPWASLCSPSGA